MKRFISFEQDRVVYAGGRISGGYLVVSQVFTAEAPGGLSNGRIRDREAVQNALTGLVQEHHLRGKKVGIVVSGLTAASRELSLPEVQSEKELRDTVINEMLYRHSGMDNEYVIDYMELPRREDKPGVSVLATAIQRECLEGYLDVVLKAGLYCNLIDTEPNCMGKLLHACYPEVKSAILAFIANNNITLLLVEQDICVFSRTVALNIDQFEQSGSMDFLAEEISGHLDKMISFEATRRGAIPAEKILLMGKKPQLEQLLPRISGEQERPCEIFSAPNGIKAPEGTALSDYVKPLGALIRRK